MRAHDEEVDPARRQLLLAALGAMASGWAPAGVVEAAEMIAGRSIYLLRGTVLVNGKPAAPTMRIFGSDLIETGADGEIVFRIESDAFILRPNSRLQINPPPGDNTLAQGLRLLTGALLAVFAHRPHRIRTVTAQIGIRGTGVYCEVEPDRDYICTCYGITDLAALDDASSQATVEAGHHESRYILREGAVGRRIRKASFKNHTDAELTLIESLVGRTPAFRGATDGYRRPRRRDY